MTAWSILGVCWPAAGADGLDRLKPARLEAVQRAIESFRKQRVSVDSPGPWYDVRANLHVHSAFSHDSRGTLDEIVAAAKRVGTRVLMFTEHPADHYDFVRDGHQGIRDGVLLIPGAEMKGFLCYPTQSLRGIDPGTPQELCDLVCGRDGLMFVSHLEERMDWEVRGVTGVEIYNTHADFKDETALLKALKNPLWLLQSAELFRRFPQAAFSALQDYPADYLRRFDELCAAAPHTGVSANDAHQNVGLVMKLVEGDIVLIEDALGKKLLDLPARDNAVLEPLLRGKQPGDTLIELRIDPYEQSLRHVGTHLLLESDTELTRERVSACLQAGRCYVAFDWIADASGFGFEAEAGTNRHGMGERFDWRPGIRLVARAPLPAEWRLFRNGVENGRCRGRQIALPIEEPGRYRVEAWLEIAGEQQIWILSNPITVSGQ